MFHLQVLNRNGKRMSGRVTTPSVKVMYPPNGGGIMFIKFKRFFFPTGSIDDPENDWDQIEIYNREDAEKLVAEVSRELHKLDKRYV